MNRPYPIHFDYSFALISDIQPDSLISFEEVILYQRLGVFDHDDPYRSFNQTKSQLDLPLNLFLLMVFFIMNGHEVIRTIPVLFS